MVNKGLIALLLGSAVIGAVLITRKAPPIPPTVPDKGIPSVSDIMAAGTLATLDAFYNHINGLYLSGTINRVTYDALYEAYVTRFHELAGG